MKYGLSRSEQWYWHTTEPVIETEKVKMLWDISLSIQTDHMIQHIRPDIVVVEKDNKIALVVDIAVLGPRRHKSRGQELIRR